jgi:homoserine O-acetyltransferase/O-succinyltransferase
MRVIKQWLLAAALSFAALPALAADYPAPKEGDWVAPEFKFHTGKVVPSLPLRYVTIGNPDGKRVLILHGTNQSGRFV